jgi:hypothetical protein
LPICIIRSGENVPLKAFTIAAVHRFIRRGGASRLHADIYEPVAYDLGVAVEIVKYGALVGAASAGCRSGRL